MLRAQGQTQGAFCIMHYAFGINNVILGKVAIAKAIKKN